MVDSATSYLLISVYMPTDYGASSVSDFLHTLGELEGFIDTQCCDVTIVVGDFNVDHFDRDGPLAIRRPVCSKFIANYALPSHKYFTTVNKWV